MNSFLLQKNSHQLKKIPTISIQLCAMRIQKLTYGSGNQWKKEIKKHVDMRSTRTMLSLANVVVYHWLWDWKHPLPTCMDNSLSTNKSFWIEHASTLSRQKYRTSKLYWPPFVRKRIREIEQFIEGLNSKAA